MKDEITKDQNLVGKLSIRVMAGREIKPIIQGSLLKWRSSSANPYCLVKYDTHKFETTISYNNLNPVWEDEVFDIQMPLPSEQHMQNNQFDNMQSKSKPMKKQRSYQFNQQCPQIHILVYHREEYNEESTNELNRDLLIGETIVSVLPAILHESSAFKKWLPICDHNFNQSGEILVSMHYHPCGLDPIPGDLIRLIGFGGSSFLSKVVPAGAKLQVVYARGETVVGSYHSSEGWDIVLEFHRNVIHVIHRPNLLADTKTQIQYHVEAIKRSSLGRKLYRLFQRIPQKNQNQLFLMAGYLQTAGLAFIQVVSTSYEVLGRRGIKKAWECLKINSMQRYSILKSQFYDIDWSVEECQSIDDTSEVIDIKKENILRNSDSGMEIECPEQLICPITRCPMIDPVVAADGHSYEREAIIHWLSCNKTSPMTGISMSTSQVFPNFTLKNLSQNFMEQRDQVLQKKKKTK